VTTVDEPLVEFRCTGFTILGPEYERSPPSPRSRPIAGLRSSSVLRSRR
jgi:hypothetical protein